MRLLLDTHALIWLIEEPRRLSLTVRNAFEQETPVFASILNFWEIHLKRSLGNLRLTDNWTTVYDTFLQEHGVATLGLERRHCAAIEDLPFLHRDPFDRMLIAQARTEGLTLVTGDRLFEQYGLSTIW